MASGYDRSRGQNVSTPKVTATRDIPPAICLSPPGSNLQTELTFFAGQRRKVYDGGGSIGILFGYCQCNSSSTFFP